MSQLLDFISEQISAEHIDTIASRLGTTREQTENAISMAVPTLVGAMASKANDDQGASELHQHLGSHFSGQQFANAQAQGLNSGALSGLGDIWGGPRGGQSALGDLLRNLLGHRQGKVENGIGKASGMSTAQVSAMLAMLAPIVLRAMAKKSNASSDGGFDFGSLTSMLRHEKRSMENQATGGLLGGLLDQDGDGDFDFRDIMHIGMKRLFGSRK